MADRDDTLVRRVTIPADPAAVSGAMSGLQTALADRRHPAALHPTWQIVLAEALNNIAEHACAGRADGRITLTLEFGASALHAELRDNGGPMPGNRLPPRREPSLDVAVTDLPEGGFGWTLIHDLTTSLQYDRQDDENILILTVPFDVAADL